VTCGPPGLLGLVPEHAVQTAYALQHLAYVRLAVAARDRPSGWMVTTAPARETRLLLPAIR
jgi:hypothetical protein